eukprot:1791222-Rhodomonas_salina.5
MQNCHGVTSTGLACRAISLRICYRMRSTDLGHDATAPGAGCAVLTYGAPTGCAVLSSDMMVSGPSCLQRRTPDTVAPS